MDKISQQLARFESLDVWAIVLDILVDNKELIAEMNRTQLFKGETSEGDKIHPNYFEDDYFKTKGQAMGYAKFKAKIKANPYFSEKGFSTPDFFITGKLVHNMITAYISGRELIIEPEGEAAGFDAKYKNIYGLNEENLSKIREIVYPAMMEKIRKHLGYGL
jgi:hypothetical protein